MPSRRKSSTRSKPTPLPPNRDPATEEVNDLRVEKEDNVKERDDQPEEEAIPVIVSPAAAQELHPTDSLALYLAQGHANYLDPQLSAQGYIPHTELYSGLWSNVSVPLLCVGLFI